MALKDDPRRLVAEAYPFAVALDTRFADLDVNRHLNNVAIANLFEEVRVRFNRTLRAVDGARMRFLVAHVAIDYLAEGSYPAPIEARAAVVTIGRTSWRVGLALFQDGACVALCDSVLVARDEAGPVAVGDGFRAVLAGRMLGNAAARLDGINP